eukprot:CAMPEP_0179077616 /NCGR_PEP_ID=MMETSP0796-20121207/34705_1 /TAXON_ID=73915 /ORGANISM="Pyrodinium bahamense, Strain pbaha01" /LENGTH=154 /DNA_ID=CAMNT_0020774899 /DNA_START=639 /DNA_END=1104 /DNA_ORIENTATION=-
MSSALTSEAEDPASVAELLLHGDVVDAQKPVAGLPTHIKAKLLRYGLVPWHNPRVHEGRKREGHHDDHPKHALCTPEKTVIGHRLGQDAVEVIDARKQSHGHGGSGVRPQLPRSKPALTAHGAAAPVVPPVQVGLECGLRSAKKYWMKGRRTLL